MTALLAIALCCSISPAEALAEAREYQHAVARAEARGVCAEIESALTTTYQGGRFSYVVHIRERETPRLIEKHFADHWRVKIGYAARMNIDREVCPAEKAVTLIPKDY